MAKSTARKTKNLAIVGAISIGAFFPPSAIIVFGGMLPTYLVWLMDRTKGKLIGITIASVNIATLMPVLIRVWDRGNNFDAAVSTLLSPFTWIVIFAGVAVGWVIAQVFPMMVVAIITARDKARLDRTRARQKQLVEEWGAAIAEVNQPKRLN